MSFILALLNILFLFPVGIAMVITGYSYNYFHILMEFIKQNFQHFIPRSQALTGVYKVHDVCYTRMLLCSQSFWSLAYSEALQTGQSSTCHTMSSQKLFSEWVLYFHNPLRQRWGPCRPLAIQGLWTHLVWPCPGNRKQDSKSNISTAGQFWTAHEWHYKCPNGSCQKKVPNSA